MIRGTGVSPVSPKAFDESQNLSTQESASADGRDARATLDVGSDPRRLYPAQDRAVPFYVQEQGAKIGKKGERIIVTKKEIQLSEMRLLEVSQLVTIGNVGISAQALHLLMEHRVPMIHLSTGGWFHGISHGQGLRNAYNRSAQYAAATDPLRCLTFAREIVRAKAANQRVLLQRNGNQAIADKSVLMMGEQLKSMPGQNFTTLSHLLGWEGQAAASYFAAFETMLKTGEMGTFYFNSRNRRIISAGSNPQPH